MTDYCEQYGPWALIAGGAQGIGAAYCKALAAKGLNIATIDIDAPARETLGATLRNEFGVDYLGLNIDLAAADMCSQIAAALAEREVGMLVYNAGIADVGPFYKSETGLELERRKIAVNVTGPLELSYHFAKPMLKRGRGGIILMSSGAGLQGAPYYAHYSATRAYNITLAEALWGEFKPYCVDVLACVAGMTLSTAAAGYSHLDTSEFQTTDEVAQEALGALGQQPTLIVGENNRQNRALLAQLPKEQQIEIIGQHAIDNFLGGTRPAQSI